MGLKTSFSTALTNALIVGESVQIYTDYDGTLFPFHPDPDAVVMDAACRGAFLQFSQFPSVSVMGLTGRDVLRARAMTSGLNMDIIGSHGVECLRQNGQIDRYSFNHDQRIHIQNFQDAAQNLKSIYPSIYIETDKYGSVGVNVAMMDGNLQTIALDNARDILMPFQNNHFEIVAEGPLELELRPRGFGKDFGINEFGNPDRKILTLFFCDSLGDHGTDRAAASMINNPTYFERGYVGMVLNGRNAPPAHNDSAAPAVIFDSPHALGTALQSIINTALSARIAPPAPNFS